MARRSTRLSSIQTSQPTTTSTKKRTAPTASATSTPRATKAAKRTSAVNGSAKTTPKTSQHFPKREYDDATGLTSSSEDVDGDDDAVSEAGSDFAAAAAESAVEVMSEPSSEEALESESEEVKPRRGKGGRGDMGKGKGTGLVVRSKGKGEALPAPGTEVVIKKPKARGAGETAYEDRRVHPNTLVFLGELRRNNEREWLKMHDPDFRQAEKDWKSFVECLTEKLMEVDDEIPELPVKDIVFRIYRDVRFSPDPTPYKPHFSAAWSRTGRKGPYGAYYLQISQGESFIGGGSWCPESQPLSRLRTDIDRRPQRFKSVLMDERMRKEFLGGAPKDEKKVVQKFVSSKTNKEYALKTRPQGYDKDHIDIDLLRLKNFTIGRQLTDEEVVSPNFLDRVADLMGVMKPFIHYLNNVIMPDPDAEDDEEEEDDSDEDDPDEADE
ncbi:sterol 24-C-methyltransferase [Elsinoe australis]|uniref:Sterol 24-C-methyltransferase n=1 Tax=Elsinoe australis TaxID=40998 RepID=A0A2P7YBY7_9PEZI|nr:sterol 24-C-methyltransferase [Elsinoe australis]